ncbi:HNH endonuclease signature motif containing protein [Vibrio vulnificus]|nr:HNH endonuclease [Vibrio vulnificus]HDY7788925.1 HNH endonuclease [Vibrio vulnificus]
MELTKAYLEHSIPIIDSLWDSDKICSAAIANEPESVLGSNISILKADRSIIALSWFIESVYDYNLADDSVTYAQVFNQVRRGLSNLGFDSDHKDYLYIASRITRLCFSYICNSSNRKRKAVTKSLKLDLLEDCDNKPKCWICGHKFCDESINKFLGEPYKIKLPTLIDMYFPSGLSERDYVIEVEHKKPFSTGGADLDDINNIALSCGFCNRHKWKFISLYDVNRSLRGYLHPRLGLVSIPQPYWAIRLLALSEKCNEPGCTVKKSHAKLYIDVKNPLGSMSPTNMQVVCRRHRKRPGDRMVSSVDYKQRIKYSRASIL